MKSDAQVATVVQLLADASRVAMLWALSDGRPVPATELARAANVKPSTASAHLSRLVAGGLVVREKRGRQRLYRLTRPEIIEAMEGLARIAPVGPARTFREGKAAAQVREARTCYDHLAGRRAVLIARALEQRSILLRAGTQYSLGPEGEGFFASLGIDVEHARKARRTFARACLDWSEREGHLAGALGAALLERMLELCWIERTDASRAVTFSNAGRRALHDVFGLDPRL